MGIRAHLPGAGLCFLAAAQLAVADPVANGNDMALNYFRAAPEAKAQVQKEAAGKLHVFRFLSVSEPVAAETNRPVVVTIEPSSGLTVEVVVSGKLSRNIASTLSTGECVAVQGRVVSVGVAAPDRIVVDPAVILHKDRRQPKAGAELLHEVNPKAH